MSLTTIVRRIDAASRIGTAGAGAALERRIAALRARSERGAQAAEYAMLGGVSAAAGVPQRDRVADVVLLRGPGPHARDGRGTHRPRLDAGGMARPPRAVQFKLRGAPPISKGRQSFTQPG